LFLVLGCVRIQFLLNFTQKFAGDLRQRDTVEVGCLAHITGHVACVGRADCVEVFRHTLVVAAHEHLNEIFAADVHTGGADFDVVGFRFSSTVLQGELMAGDVAAVQTAARAAGGGFCSGLRASRTNALLWSVYAPGT
jgi:hypothetical protein